MKKILFILMCFYSIVCNSQEQYPILGEYIYRDVNNIYINDVYYDKPCRIYLESSKIYSNSVGGVLPFGMNWSESSNNTWVKVKIKNQNREIIYKHKFNNCFMYINELGEITVRNGGLYYVILKLKYNKININPFTIIKTSQKEDYDNLKKDLEIDSKEINYNER